MHLNWEGRRKIGRSEGERNFGASAASSSLTRAEFEMVPRAREDPKKTFSPPCSSFPLLVLAQCTHFPATGCPKKSIAEKNAICGLHIHLITKVFEFFSFRGPGQGPRLHGLCRQDQLLRLLQRVPQANVGAAGERAGRGGSSAGTSYFEIHEGKCVKMCIFSL